MSAPAPATRPRGVRAVTRYSLTHLSDPELVRALKAAAVHEKSATADLLAHLAEVDARGLYLLAAYTSMYAYCVRELNLSEDAAYKRIQAARTAREFPAVLQALADGRLHLSGVVLLGPCLNESNCRELLDAAAGKSKSEIESLLARRFPRSEALPLVTALPAATTGESRLAPERLQAQEGLAPQLAPAQVGTQGIYANELAPGRVDSRGTTEVQLPPGTVPASISYAKVTPVAPERFALQLTMSQATHDTLRYAQSLLGHQIPSGELAEVLDRALDALIAQLERSKFAATNRPRPGQKHASADPRHIPAEVKRAVWERDGGRCTFVSEDGHRCEARSRLEYDHVQPVAQGGKATVENLRLRCRAHNQFTAEKAFGPGLVHEKRQRAKEKAAQRVEDSAAQRARAAESARAAAAERARIQAEDREIAANWARARAEALERGRAIAETMPWLRGFGPLPARVRGAAERDAAPVG